MTKKTSPSPKDELVSFTPATDFRGKPFPGGPAMAFRAGIPSSPVPQSWVDSLSDKKTGDA